MHSCIYEGRVRHRRFEPIAHDFTYRLFTMYLDLDELPSLFERRWLWSYERRNVAAFHRSDHLGDPARPLADEVRALVEARTGSRPAGPVRLLTHLRYFGYVLNPVSFYFCFDRAGDHVEAIVADVTNTPWGERHAYVLPIAAHRREATKQQFQSAKEMHVSPFLDMDMTYHWSFLLPGRRLTVRIENHAGERRVFDATLALQRRELTGASLARVLAVYPLMTAQVMAGIYTQALRLWVKGAPFFAHPRYRDSCESELSLVGGRYRPAALRPMPRAGFGETRPHEEDRVDALRGHRSEAASSRGQEMRTSKEVNTWIL